MCDFILRPSTYCLDELLGPQGSKAAYKASSLTRFQQGPLTSKLTVPCDFLVVSVCHKASFHTHASATQPNCSSYGSTRALVTMVTMNFLLLAFLIITQGSKPHVTSR